MDAAPDFSLEGRSALVTASGRGLGRAIALALAHAGADVALGLRDGGSGAETAGAIEALGRRAVRLQMDMTSLDEIRAGIDRATQTLGGIDILVNNAGIARVSRAESVRVEDFDATLAVNLK